MAYVNHRIPLSGPHAAHALPLCVSLFPFHLSFLLLHLFSTICSALDKHSLHRKERRDLIHYSYLFICHVLTIYTTIKLRVCCN